MSCTPLAYLGKNTVDDGTDYALLCSTHAVVPDPDIFIVVQIIHQDEDGKAYVKSSYQLLGRKSFNSIEDSNLSCTFESGISSGYAQGTISLYAEKSGTYKLYWADDQSALTGYYPIAELSMKDNSTKTVTMGYHTVIPANATKLIATTGSLNVSDAYAVYNIPFSRRLENESGRLLYTFSTYSDIHIDKGNFWYVNAEANLKQALDFSTKMGSDYIIVSGDCVTNDSGPDKECEVYEKILSKSDYVNPIWESDGNHDLRQDVSSGLKSFIKASGTDGSDSGKPYYYMIEPKTGDMFIFMALELNKSPGKYDVLTDEQLDWVTDLLEKNYNDRNIFLIQHAPVKGFGAGDRMDDPYYSGLMNPSKDSQNSFLWCEYHKRAYLSQIQLCNGRLPYIQYSCLFC